MKTAIAIINRINLIICLAAEDLICCEETG